MSLDSNFNREWKPMCERQFDLGFVEGEKRGIEIGRDQGLEIGEERGITKEKLATATNMLYANCDFEFINKITGLDLSTIQDLAKNLKKQ